MVAIKLLLMFDDITTDRVLKEVAALAQLRHPNLILFMGKNYVSYHAFAAPDTRQLRRHAAGQSALLTNLGMCMCRLLLAT